MGSRIARRLLEAGHELTVWNRSPGPAAELAAAGARAAPSAAQAAAAAEAVVVMVSDPVSLDAVVAGLDGVAAGIGAGATLVQMSTVGPAAVHRAAASLPEGAEFLDAPVLGSISEAESGSLTVFAGGSPELVERWTPLLSALGAVVRVGGVGAGSAAKLVANSTLFGVLGVLGEALALADGIGLEREATWAVLAATPLAAQAERRRPAFESGDFPQRFSLALARKDADLVTEAAAEAAVDARLAEAARRWLVDAEAAGRGGLDYSALLAFIGEARR